MKNTSIIITLTVILFSCEKHNQHELNQTSSIDNKLILGEGHESFQRIIGGIKSDVLYSVKQTVDLGYISCGFTQNDSATERDIFILKTNINGETDWIRLFSDEYMDQGWDIELTTDNSFIIAATSSLHKHIMYESNPYCGQILKISENGNMIWKKSYSFGDFTHFSNVRQTIDGCYILAGTELSSKQAILLKTDTYGNEQWRKTFSSNTGFNHIEITTDGGFIICGDDNRSSIKQCDIFIVKTNNIGDTIWTRTIGDNYDNSPTTIKLIPSGYIICGYNINTPTGASGFIARLDINGNIIWTRDYDSNNIQHFEYIIFTNDNELLSIAGESFSTNSKCYLIKLKFSNGDIIWQKTFNPGDNNILYEVRQTLDNGYIIAGYSRISGNGNGYLIKTDVNGN